MVDIGGYGGYLRNRFSDDGKILILFLGSGLGTFYIK